GVKDFYVAKGLPAQKFDVIPNGISVPAAPTATRESALACAGMEEGDFVIGAVGRLWPQKRQKDLIWAAHLLEEAGHRIRLLIIGDGPQRWRLERYARQVFPDRDTVVFLGHRDDVASLMPHFDCFWLASGYEGQSNALMEAMSCGVPAVVSDIAGNRDLVVPDETGLLVAVGDRAGFTKQTHRLIEDPDLRARLANNSQQRMREQFSVQRMVERYGQLYQSLVDART
ncbi:MAG TPA: glycosyl transferase family 1, partial [Planctomycetaceae bacterium]|nr:glycosyl transferase family 1 [Planctomycetaceae bacterium]